MSQYDELRLKVTQFIKKEKINAYDLQRVAKDLCCCASCKFYVEHFTRDGRPVDFGHCTHGSIPKTRKPNMASCGSWEDYC